MSKGAGHGTVQRNVLFPLPSLLQRAGYHWFVVGTVCIGAFMAALDASVINVALPALKRDFHTQMQIIEWVSLAYILTLAALIVPLSRLADTVGRRTMYSSGFSIFIAGSFLCGLAQSVSFLLICRVIQAVGAAMLQANSVAIITAITPSRDRNKAIGFQASAQGIGLSLGPALGGAFITFLGWRWIFYINVPVGIVGTVFAVMILPRDVVNNAREKFDLWGSVLVAPALVAFIYLLNEGIGVGWLSPYMTVTGAVLLICFFGFVFVENRVKYPVVDFGLFRNRTFLFGNFSSMLSFAVMYAVMFLGPFYLSDVHLSSSFNAGIYMTMIPIGMTAFTLMSGLFADKFGGRLPITIGLAMATIGCVVLSLTSVHYSAIGYSGGLLLVGAGIGSFTPPNNSQVMGSVPSNRLGITGGMLNTSRTIGMGLGVTIGGVSYQLFLKIYGVLAGSNFRFLTVRAFQNSFITIAVMAIMTVLVALFSQPKKEYVPQTNQPWDMYMI